MWRAAVLTVALCLLACPASAESSLASALDAAVRAHDFSGAVLVVDHGSIVFDRAYGLADRVAGLPNRTTTSFRVGSLTSLFIAGGVLALADKGRLRLDNTAEQFVGGAEATPIGDLLGRSDAAAVVILGGVLEGAAHEPLADALDDSIFSPRWMTGTALDTGKGGSRVAHAYRGPALALTVYSTTRDLLRWTQALLGGDLVSPAGRQVLLARWQKVPGARAGMSVVASGEAAIVAGPAPETIVIVLSNAGDTAPSQLATGLAALLPDDGPLPGP